MSKVAVSIIRQPERIHRAEESTVEDVPSIGLESNIPAFAEVGVLVNREVFVEVLETADIRILPGSIPEAQRPGVRPSRLVKITVGSRILKRSGQAASDFVRELVVIKEEPSKIVIRSDR